MSFAKQRQSSCYRIERDEARAEVIDLRARIRELEAGIREHLEVVRDTLHAVEAIDRRLWSPLEVEPCEKS